MREQFGQLAQLQVFGAEIVAPLRHAVGFVDGEQRDVQVAQEASMRGCTRRSGAR
jgi:hypothetical protein